MNSSSETYSSEVARTEQDQEISRILLKIHRKWRQSGRDEVSLAKAATPPEEMETVLLQPAYEAPEAVSLDSGKLTKTAPPPDEAATVIIQPAHETTRPAPLLDDEELTETIILMPRSYVAPVDTVAEPVEELAETVVIRPDAMRETSPTDDVNAVEEESDGEETVVLGGAVTPPGQPAAGGEDELGETVILPPKKDLFRRGRTR